MFLRKARTAAIVGRDLEVAMDCHGKRRCLAIIDLSRQLDEAGEFVRIELDDVQRPRAEVDDHPFPAGSIGREVERLGRRDRRHGEADAGRGSDVIQWDPGGDEVDRHTGVEERRFHRSRTLVGSADRVEIVEGFDLDLGPRALFVEADSDRQVLRE